MASLLSSIGAVDLQALAETVKQKGGSLVQEASALADKLSLDRLQDGDQTVRPPSSSPSEGNKREGVYSRAAVALSREINIGNTREAEEAKVIPSRQPADASRGGEGSGRSTPMGMATAGKQQQQTGSGAATPVKGVAAGSSRAASTPPPGAGPTTSTTGPKVRKLGGEGGDPGAVHQARGLDVSPAAPKPQAEATPPKRVVGSVTPPSKGAGVSEAAVAREGTSPPRPARRSVFADDDDDEDEDDPIMAAMLGRPPPQQIGGTKAGNSSASGTGVSNVRQAGASGWGAASPEASRAAGVGDRVGAEGGDEEAGLLAPAAAAGQQRPGLPHSSSSGAAALEGMLGAIGGSVQLDALKDRATAVWSATSGGMKDAFGKVWTKAREQQASQQQLPQRQPPSRTSRTGRQANDMDVVVTRAADVLTEQERQHLASLRNQGVLSSLARLLPARVTNINRMYCGVILLFVSTVIFYWRWSFLWS